MAQPNSGDLHPVNELLTEFGIAYMQGDNGFVFDKVFPVVPVARKSNRYNIWNKEDWFRDEAKPRAGNAESAGSGYNTSTDTYNCDVFAIHKDIDYQSRAEADPVFDLGREAAEFVTQRLMLRQERQWVTDYFATGIWGTDNTPGTLWSDYVASDPGANVDAGKRTVLLNTGQEPNTFVLGYDVYRVLRRHPDIKSFIGLPLGASRSASEEDLARFFGVDRVLVARAVYSTANEGAPYAGAFAVGGTNALLCYVAPSVGPNTATAGVTFAWTGLEGAGYGKSLSIASIDLRGSGRKVDRIEAEAAWDNKVTASDMGYFFSGAVS